MDADCRDGRLRRAQATIQFEEEQRARQLAGAVCSVSTCDGILCPGLLAAAKQDTRAPGGKHPRDFESRRQRWHR